MIAVDGARGAAVAALRAGLGAAGRPEERAAAAWMIAMVGGRPFADDLPGLLASSDAPTAAAALAPVGATRALAPLVTALSTGSSEAVRRAAALALGVLGGPRARAALCAAARSDQEDILVRSAAVVAVGWAGDQGAVRRLRPLARCADEVPPEVTSAARWALGQPFAVPPRSKVSCPLPEEPHRSLVVLLQAGPYQLRLAGALLAPLYGDARLIGTIPGHSPALRDLAAHDPYRPGWLRGFTVRRAATAALRQLGAAHCALFGSRYRQLLCAEHLTRFVPYAVRLRRGETITCYGCRTCGQSRAFVVAPQVVIRLGADVRGTDTTAPAGAGALAAGSRYVVHWRARLQLCDVDCIEIGGDATERQVLEFLNATEGDRDRVRREGYPRVPCVVAPHLHLSENVLNALSDAFALRDHAGIGDRDPDGARPEDWKDQENE